MAFNPYAEQYRPDMDAIREQVEVDYAFCKAQLTDIGAPPTVYIDIYWDGDNIKDIATDTVLTLSGMDLKFKYFNHLRGLFRKAYENKYFSP